jgi:SpoVK/Ycf46/Vps4 family AAA+-type ATPase
METPPFAARRLAWRAAVGSAVADEELDALAARYRYTCREIEAAVTLARSHAGARNADLSYADVVWASRGRSSARLGGLARVVTPRARWEELVLPDDTIAQLREICVHVRQRPRVLHEWGFDRRLTLGKGLYALFVGPSGTGKTLAAEVIAGSLGLDLVRVDLAAVVSKYIGETEKNLERIFRSAEGGDAVLFFDEADALFGRRSEIKDAHDRYANIEVDFLLQRLEQYEGVVILASNLAQNIDESFTRRMQFTVEFPFPTEPLRLAIWRNHFPPETPIERDLDFPYMAHEFKIAGGHIRKIVLNAAFLAADDGGVVGMKHLLKATRREYERMGKLYPGRVS